MNTMVKITSFLVVVSHFPLLTNDQVNSPTPFHYKISCNIPTISMNLLSVHQVCKDNNCLIIFFMLINLPTKTKLLATFYSKALV